MKGNILFDLFVIGALGMLILSVFSRSVPKGMEVPLYLLFGGMIYAPLLISHYVDKKENDADGAPGPVNVRLIIGLFAYILLAAGYTLPRIVLLFKK